MIKSSLLTEIGFRNVMKFREYNEEQGGSGSMKKKIISVMFSCPTHKLNMVKSFINI